MEPLILAVIITVVYMVASKIFNHFYYEKYPDKRPEAIEAKKNYDPHRVRALELAEFNVASTRCDDPSCLTCMTDEERLKNYFSPKGKKSSGVREMTLGGKPWPGTTNTISTSIKKSGAWHVWEVKVGDTLIGRGQKSMNSYATWAIEDFLEDRKKGLISDIDGVKTWEEGAKIKP